MGMVLQENFLDLMAYTYKHKNSLFIDWQVLPLETTFPSSTLYPHLWHNLSTAKTFMELINCMSFYFHFHVLIIKFNGKKLIMKIKRNYLNVQSTPTQERI